MTSRARTLPARTIAALGSAALAATTVAVSAPTATAVATTAKPTAMTAAPHPVAAAHSTHPLDAAAGRAAALSRADATEARTHADGRRVAVSRASSPVDVPDLSVIGITWGAGSAPGTTAQYRTETSGVWTDWTFIDVDDDHRPEAAESRRGAKRTGGARDGSAPLVSTDADRIQVRLVSPAGEVPDDAELMVVDPGTSSYDAATSKDATPTSTSTSTSAPAPSTTSSSASSTAPATSGQAGALGVAQPAIYTRAQWGADESLREQTEPDHGVVDAAFVHHTAGTNTYTSGQVPAIIRGIYEYHVNGHGWRDIGYNFLIDRWGRTWEGRYGGMAKAVVGAHAYGVNSWTFGVSVLGNFQTAQPNSYTLNALSKLIAWKADLHRFDVLGRVTINGHVYNGISGHRDAYDNSTECPGAYLYAKLPSLRTMTAALSPSATRVYGSSYEIAARLSARTFATGAEIAYVTNPSSEASSLGAGAAGGHLGGPLLFATKDSIPSVTSTELKRLKPKKIIILGGSAGISTAVRTQLGAYAPMVDRITGADRYVLAANLSARAFRAGGPVAYVTTGAKYAQAVVAGAPGGHRGGPVLLSTRDSVPAATKAELQRLKPAEIVIVGASSAISTTTRTQLASLAPTVTRYSGADAPAVAASLSRGTFAAGVPVAYVATTANFSDALVASAAGGHLGGPVLLTGRDTLPQSTLSELTRLRPARIIVVGHSTSVSKAAAQRLYNYEEPAAR